VGEILLISADWQFRALVRAQLLEEGFQVRALSSLEAALATLMGGSEQPRLTILDLQGVEGEARAVSDLWRLTGEASLILCGGPSSQADLSQEGWPPARVMLRPFRIGDVVKEVRRLWGWTEGVGSVD
jgi:DNA-binding response OmpR family regulator